MLYIGVNRVLILALVENVSERYYNVRSILEVVKLGDLKCTLALDFKLVNVILGISVSMCERHCCIYNCTCPIYL